MSVEYIDGRKGFLGKLKQGLRKQFSRDRKIEIARNSLEKIVSANNFADKVALFNSIEIETRTRCNSTCSFCAASILTDKRPDIMMPDEIFEKILSDLVALEYAGKVNFFVNNEPLLDPRLPDMIAATHQRLPKANTEVHTNGLKLNARNGRELFERGLDHLVINNYSQEGEVHKGVQKFLDEVPQDFPDRKVTFFMRLLDEQLYNRAGTAPNSPPINEPLPLSCVLPFMEMVVTANGAVSLCCQDHNFEHVMGNVKNERLDEIWFNEKFAELRKQLLAEDRTGNKFCIGCDHRGFRDDHVPDGPSLNQRAAGPFILH